MTVLRLVCHKAKCFQRGGCCSLGEQVVESEKSYAEAVEHFEKEGFITTSGTAAFPMFSDSPFSRVRSYFSHGGVQYEEVALVAIIGTSPCRIRSTQC